MDCSEPTGADIEPVSKKPCRLTAYPTVEELMSKPATDLRCRFSECGKLFQHPNALHWHLVKTHKIVESERDESILTRRKKVEGAETTETHFYCPDTSCYYHKVSFDSLKRLKDHYLNVHAEKAFVCPNCKLGFGQERALKRHRQSVCGITWDCSNCDRQFASKTAMQTHCKKNGHRLGKIIKDRYNQHSSVNTPAITRSVITNSATVTSSTTSRVTATASESSVTSGVDVAVGDDTPSSTSCNSCSLHSAPDNVNDSMTRPSEHSVTVASSHNDQNRSVLPPPPQPVIIINVMNVVCSDSKTPQSIRGYNGQRTLWPKVSPADSANTSSFNGPVTCSTQTNIVENWECGKKRSKVSKGSQISPKSRQKTPKSMKTQCVQTSAKKRRRQSNPTQTISVPALPLVDDLFCLSDVETQTNTLIEELQASLGASISTQTKDSFLSTNPDIVEASYSVADLTTAHLDVPSGVSMAAEAHSSLAYPLMSSNGTDPMPQTFTNLATLSPVILEPNFYHSNTQTQTMETMFEQYLNNMETQTFDDFDFIDNETQTAAPQSVETQTSLHGLGQMGSATNVQSTDIQTQTMATDFDPSLIEFANLISGLH